jgi:hypothetical protein
MKLNRTQIKKLKDHDWNIVKEKVDGIEQNCRWIGIYPEDGTIFGEVVEQFGLTGEHDSVRLLVVATIEED